MIKFLQLLQLKAMALTMPILANGNGGAIYGTEESDKIAELVKLVGNIVIPIATSIAVILIVIQLIKAGVIMANADRSGPEQTQKAKSTIKSCVIGLIIVAVASIFLGVSINTWIENLIRNLWNS